MTHFEKGTSQSLRPSTTPLIIQALIRIQKVKIFVRVYLTELKPADKYKVIF